MAVNKQKGFSLIEILISIVILAGFISAIVQLSYGNTRRIQKARRLEKIAQLLEFKMSELKERFKGRRIDNLPKEEEGNFENEPAYFWKYQTQGMILPPPRLFLAVVNLPEEEANMRVAEVLTQILSESVIELKLTVYYERKKGKPFSSSLVSYFVNYEKAPDLIFKYMSNFSQGVPTQGL